VKNIRAIRKYFKMIKTPAIFLSFDDRHIEEWFNALSLFEKYEAKITFYLTHIPLITEKEWKMVGDFKEAGHTIGFHGTNHLDARKFITKMGCQKYIFKEISPGIEILRKKGFDDIQNFAYPYGRDGLEAEKCLSKHFNTLRTIGFRFYSKDEIKKNLKLIIKECKLEKPDGTSYYVPIHISKVVITKLKGEGKKMDPLRRQIIERKLGYEFVEEKLKAPIKK